MRAAGEAGSGIGAMANGGSPLRPQELSPLSRSVAWRYTSKLHLSFQRAIEKVFFRGRSTRTSVYLTYAIGNVILMLLLFYVGLNRIAYDWTGQLYPVGSGFRLDFLTGSLEDSIPFVPQMVIFYVYLFYPMVILTMLYFAFVEYKKGYALGWSLVFINGVAVLVYAIFPVSVYWWHQTFLAQPMVGNFWADQAYSVWAGDTTFNCFPSLHAAVSTVCFYAWYRYGKVRPGAVTAAISAVTLLITAGVILSTLFLKQHYVADEVAGVVLAWGIGRPLFNRLWKKNTIEAAGLSTAPPEMQRTPIRGRTPV